MRMRINMNLILCTDNNNNDDNNKKVNEDMINLNT